MSSSDGACGVQSVGMGLKCQLPRSEQAELVAAKRIVDRELGELPDGKQPDPEFDVFLAGWIQRWNARTEALES